MTADGKPLANAEVTIQFTDRIADEKVRQKLYRDTNYAAVRTNAAGRFRLDGQAPGLGVFAHAPGLRFGASTRPVTPKAGEVTDLGDLKVPTKRD